jgi:hypothetical protein
VVRAGVERDRSFGKRTYMPDGPPGVRMSGNGTTEIEGMVRGVDDEMDELADAVAADVADLLDVRTEYVSSRFEYDHRTREETATVRIDVGLAEGLRERYDGIKLGDSGGVEIHITVDTDRA